MVIVTGNQIVLSEINNGRYITMANFEFRINAAPSPMGN